MRNRAAAEDGEQRYDVVVVGGGGAGLSGALALVRARRTVLVIDSGRPRNAPAGAVHAYLGREGTPPAELLAIGRDEVARYGGTFLNGSVAAVRRLGDQGFRVVLADKRAVRARRLLVATGLVDELPEVPGLAPRWGRDVLYCPYCHGWEVQDQPIGILSTDRRGVHQALLWRQWSRDITLFLHTGPEPTAEDYGKLAARGIAVVPGRVTALETAGGRLHAVRLHAVRPEAGNPVRCRVLVVAPRFAARADFLTSVGLKPAEHRVDGRLVGTYVASDGKGATAVPGVYAAGNVTNPNDQVMAAAVAGARAAAAVNTDLIDEETRRAVSADRDRVGAGRTPAPVAGKAAHGLRRPWWAAGGGPPVGTD
ncbi:thioredoxin reductase (NADPH) [Sinosporangium album]|uniref:Thioredoxin reductase (NADPH) n=1 Tax=Sinosporangium album TaxID=504805 RepID=A0A1G8IHH8_9ACTN|nr:NAD(P)/FAD-dependent oxidoreductase [Sinosporangium album]SDI18488.1 thioredoxin reductase (NADPH) [Sinosporangium album]